MNVYFDTSVLVSAFVDQLPNHEPARRCFSSFTDGEHTGHVSTHSLAEVYAILTTLPVERRVSGLEAEVIVRTNLVERLVVVDLVADDYMDTLSTVARGAFAGGIVYDGLHVAAAQKGACSRIFTYNVKDFTRLCPETIEIATP